MGNSNVNDPQGSESALSVQAGGDHYKKSKIQPTQLAYLVRGTPAFHSVAKYFRTKSDRDGDLDKSIHYCELERELLTEPQGSPYYRGVSELWVRDVIGQYSEQFFAGGIVKEILIALTEYNYDDAINLLNKYKILGKTNVK